MLVYEKLKESYSDKSHILQARADVPVELALALIRNRNTREQPLMALFQNKGLRPLIQEDLAKCHNEMVKYLLVLDTDEPELLHILSQDAGSAVGAACGANPHLSETDMRALEKRDATVQRGLASNPHLPFDLVQQFLKSEVAGVRIACIANGDLGDANIDQLLRSPDGKIRRALFLNPHLTTEQRLRLAVERFVVEEDRENDYTAFQAIGRREALIPWEVKFARGENVVFTPTVEGTTVGNAALLDEIGQWYGPPGGPRVRTDGECSLSRAEIMAEGLTWWAWRDAGDENWTVFVGNKKGSGDKWKAFEVQLPHHADGWIKVLPDGRNCWAGGMIRGTDGNGAVWLCPGTPSVARKVQFPDLMGKYEGAKKLAGGVQLQVTALGSLMYGGGLFSLWEHEGEPIGWTQEMDAQQGRGERLLNRKDLVTTQFVSNCLPRIKYAFRAYRGEEMRL